MATISETLETNLSPPTETDRFKEDIEAEIEYYKKEIIKLEKLLLLFK